MNRTKDRIWKISTLVLTGILALTFVTRAFAGPQPNMENALNSLRAARASLERAEHNKGGWRVTAIQHVDQAITAVQNGMAYSNQNSP
jgi:hypothetical protein